MKTRIKQVGDKYYPQYRSFFMWKPIEVSTRWYSSSGECVSIIFTYYLPVAKDKIDMFLKKDVEGSMKDKVTIIEHPTWGSLTYKRKK